MATNAIVDEALSSPEKPDEAGPSTSFSDAFNKQPSSINEPEPSSEDSPNWRGVDMNEIHKGWLLFERHQVPPITSKSPRHTVLYRLPYAQQQGTPKPYPSQFTNKWSQGYVRMPCSTQSKIRTEDENGRTDQCRWELIQQALLQSFVTTQMLETAILSYNPGYAQRWNFSALHFFFTQYALEEEAEIFFASLLPKIIQLALQLPTVVTGAIPLLTRHSNATISLSQQQVSCLLANAFLCTFPRRNSTSPQTEFANYPLINFNKLFGTFREEHPEECTHVMEKFKCIFHYFTRVTNKVPEGTITIQRRYVPRENCPKWNVQDCTLPPLHITSKGTIEDEGAGLLQVDFANKFLGGGVLGWGCVQEEIRFLICPELLVTMLVAEMLDDTEALIVTGVERYSRYKGYSTTFTWMGNYQDDTPRDTSGRRMTSVVAIDAMYFKSSSHQFQGSNIIRELNKAYVGFSSSDIKAEDLPPIATGNWGCGAFGGDPYLKVLLQLMVSGVIGRSVVYFTFGDKKLMDAVADLYDHLQRYKVSVGRLFALMRQYQEIQQSDRPDFYSFLYNRSKMKPINTYFSKTTRVVVEKVKPREPIARGYRPLEVTRKLTVNFNNLAFNNTKEKEEMIAEQLTSMDAEMVSPTNLGPSEKSNVINDEIVEKKQNNSQINWDIKEDKMFNSKVERLTGLERINSENCNGHAKENNENEKVPENVIKERSDFFKEKSDSGKRRMPHWDIAEDFKPYVDQVLQSSKELIVSSPESSPSQAKKECNSAKSTSRNVHQRKKFNSQSSNCQRKISDYFKTC